MSESLWDDEAIAEAVGAARDRQHMAALRRAERRERIATALAPEAFRAWAYDAGQPEDAVKYADLLIEALDRRAAEDKGE